MSNPFRPPVEPTDAQSARAALIGCAYPRLTEEELKVIHKYDTPEAVGVLLTRLGFKPLNAFKIPRHLTLHRGFTKKEHFAHAANAGFTVKARSLYAETGVELFVRRLSENLLWCSEKVIKERGNDVVFATGNPEHTVDRWEFLQKKSVIRPTKQEVLDALSACGLELESGEPVPKPKYYVDARIRERELCGLPEHAQVMLEPTPQEDFVTHNPVANAGFPVLVRMNVDGALETAIQLALEVEKKIVAFMEDMGCLPEMTAASHRWDLPTHVPARYQLAFERAGNDHFRLLLSQFLTRYEELAEQFPYLFAVQGKCKSDFYPRKKLGKAQRFYNVVGAQNSLVMRQATQGFEGRSKNVFDDPLFFTNAQGISFAHGGADALIDSLDAAYQTARLVYSHCGDDTLSFTGNPNSNWMVGFTFDLSNFDFTQQAEITADIDAEIARRLWAISAPAALLWYAFRRKRLTVMAHTVPVWLNQGGPSGLNLQSKVNSVISEILWGRLTLGLQKFTNLEKPPTEADFSAVIERTCTGMGLVGRLETFYVEKALTVRDFIRQRPMLYLGFYLHYREDLDRIVPFADPPRTLAQIRYPTTKHVGLKENFQLAERVRVASCVLGMGIPPQGEEKAFGALLLYAKKGLSTVDDNFALPSMTWLLSQVEGGPERQKNVEGLKRALDRIEDIWLKGGLAEACGDEPVVVGKLRRALDLPKLPKSLDNPVLKNFGRSGSSYAAKRAAVLERVEKMRLWRTGEQSSARTRRRDPLQYREEEYFVPVDYGDDWDEEY